MTAHRTEAVVYLDPHGRIVKTYASANVGSVVEHWVTTWSGYRTMQMHWTTAALGGSGEER